MKKKKEATQPQVSYAIRVRRERSNRRAMVIDGSLTVKSKMLNRKSPYCPPAKFTIIIDDDEFKKLYEYAYHHEDFGFQFGELLRDAFYKCWKKKARGNHESHASTINWIKERAAFLYILFSYINESSVKPKYFRDLIKEMPTDERLYISKGEGYDPVILTTYFLEKFYGTKQLVAMKLKPFYSDADRDHFYIRYIHPKKAEMITYFETEFTSILWQLYGVKYLLIVGEKKPRVFSDYHAKYSYSVPCDKKGKEISIRYEKKDPLYKKALAELFEVMHQDYHFTDRQLIRIGDS